MLCATAFEPGSLALAAYLLQSNVMTPKKSRKISSLRVKRFFKKHKHVLMDIVIEEAAEPAMDLANLHIHDQLLLALPPLSLSLVIYIVLIVLTIIF
jgi:hypothetical protein